MPWYAEWFDRDEYELVYQQRDDEEARKALDLLLKVTDLEPSAHLVDVGCGRGRHALELARRGYRVTGLDLSERSIRKAQALAEAEGVTDRARFVVQDMREPACHGCADGVLNLFTAFGYFVETGEHLRAVRAMAEALRPGAPLVQDFLNAEHVRRHLVPQDERRVGDLVVEQQRWIEDGAVHKTITLHGLGGDGQTARRTFTERVALLDRDDFERLYAQAGLRLVQTFGDYDGASASPDAPRLILHAEKVG